LTRCGLGVDLEAAAVRAALAEEGRPAGTFLSFNASVSALMADELPASLREPVENIVVEITEHEQVLDEPALQIVLGALRGRGARIAVDDSGAGYAGLQRIMRIGADIVKLDPSTGSRARRSSARSSNRSSDSPPRPAPSCAPRASRPRRTCASSPTSA